ncbi:spermidine synthase [Actinospica robiniae]|uniref:spermidine synthase n=1 Tax=Actinospica robiniae TaxID=304901 RepID=UPI0004096692|nr:fused MFS/spermidine synthase [Actinospica robiniae]
MPRRTPAAPASATTRTGEVRLLPDTDRPDAHLLTLDGTPQSYVDLDDPTHLEFEYVRRLAHLADLALAPESAAVDALHLGGGALTLPRYLAHTRPGSRQLAVEIDPELTEFVRTHLPLDKRARLRVRAADAREALAGMKPDSWDLVISDVFAGARTPAHLTSLEYVQLTAHALREPGVYAANLADGAPLRFARAQAATVQAVYPHVVLIAEPAVLRGRRYGNIVLAGSRHPLPVPALVRATAADPFTARVLTGDELTTWIGGAVPVTDATAADSPEPPPGTFVV